MSFLRLYRDPVLAAFTRRCDWRIRDLVEAERPTTLYLVVPPSDIRRTKPLVRLILNQIGRRLTEELDSKRGRHRLLLMLDEFPALGRLDFFESALAFMAGYGLKSFLIAQSLNQIEKAYGQSNSILDNCHVRVSFATNDERTAKRVSDALGTATELRAMKNHAGSRLSPWLGHLMISRQETARPLLTAGEVMELPPDDELVLVSGCAPIRAKKARYFEDPELQARILRPPTFTRPALPPLDADPLVSREGDWRGRFEAPSDSSTEDPANARIRREPELPEQEEIVPESKKPVQAISAGRWPMRVFRHRECPPGPIPSSSALHRCRRRHGSAISSRRPLSKPQPPLRRHQPPLSRPRGQTADRPISLRRITSSPFSMALLTGARPALTAFRHRRANTFCRRAR
jgi:type IV secretion system protein VirD4